MTDKKFEFGKKEENKPVVPQHAAAIEMYKGAIDMGTEEMTTEDVNTPYLKIVQSTTQGLENKHEGWLMRSDTSEQFQSIEVTLVYVTTIQTQNYNKTGMEKVKVYFGFYKNIVEPFRMFVRGWSMEGHRDFQSQLIGIKNKYKVPMLSLFVRLSTIKQSGTIEGKLYTTNKLKFEIERDSEGNPFIEMDADRITFLAEAVNRFKQSALIAEESPHDEVANQF